MGNCINKKPSENKYNKNKIRNSIQINFDNTVSHK